MISVDPVAFSRDFLCNFDTQSKTLLLPNKAFGPKSYWWWWAVVSRVSSSWNQNSKPLGLMFFSVLGLVYFILFLLAFFKTLPRRYWICTLIENVAPLMKRTNTKTNQSTIKQFLLDVLDLYSSRFTRFEAEDKSLGFFSSSFRQEPDK